MKDLEFLRKPGLSRHVYIFDHVASGPLSLWWKSVESLHDGMSLNLVGR